MLRIVNARREQQHGRKRQTATAEASAGRSFPSSWQSSACGCWIFGAWLAVLGGSIYYVLAGIALAGERIPPLPRPLGRAVRLRRSADRDHGLGAVGSRFDFWQLAPRGDLLVPLGILLLLPWVTRGLAPRAQLTSGAGPRARALAAAFRRVAIAALFNHPHDRMSRFPSRNASATVAYAAAPGDWPAYAGTWAGLKWSPLTQITPDNVKPLDVAWHVSHRRPQAAERPGEFTYEMTPIKVGDLLYLCTPHDIVIALDPVTGKTRWRFDPHVNVTGTQHMSCRGVSYYDPNAAPGAPPMPPRAADCSTRIFVATNDARLIALDAASGRPCAGFGTSGQLSLVPQYPGYREGWYQFTSAPLVSRGLVVLAGACSTTARSRCLRASSARSTRRPASWCGTSIPATRTNRAAWAEPALQPVVAQQLEHLGGRRTTRHDLCALRHGRGRPIWRQAAADDREIRQQHRRPRHRDRQAQMGVPDRPPRSVGHGRPRAAGADRLPDRRRDRVRRWSRRRRPATSSCSTAAPASRSSRSPSARFPATRRPAIRCPRPSPSRRCRLCRSPASARPTCGARRCSTSSAAGSRSGSSATTGVHAAIDPRQPRLSGHFRRDGLGRNGL